MEELKILIKNKQNKEFKIQLKDRSAYDLMDTHGENFLHWCCTFNNAELCEYLIIEKKLHVNLENYRHATPLYYAAMNNNLEVIKIMLKYHANPRIRSVFSGKFPSEIATDIEIKKLLQEAENLIPFCNYENYEPILRENVSLYKGYKYRLYMAYLSNLNYFNSTLSEEVKNRNGIQIFPEIKSIFQQSGIIAAANYVQQVYEDYLQIDYYNIEKLCLNCNAKTIKRCSKCKKVYFCNLECQKKCYLLHNFDCI